jgi:hypothetical protein
MSRTNADHRPDEPESDDLHGADDATLGGYFRVHERPPGFEGIDGHPYTVSIEVERTPDLRTPFEGYLVFLRWATTGLGVVGHLETPTLWRGRSEEEVLDAAGGEPLERVKGWLDQAVEAKERPTESVD